MVEVHRLQYSQAKLQPSTHLDKDTCACTAKACGKVSVEHLQAKRWEGRVERRAQVAYANLSSVKGALTNELPGVFLIGVRSTCFTQRLQLQRGKIIITKDKGILARFNYNTYF